MDILQTTDLQKNKILTYDNDIFYYCKATDLAKLTGTSILEKDRCMPLVRDDNKYYALIGKYGYLKMNDDLKKEVALRPVLNYNDLDINLIKDLKQTSIVTFKYGNYPQTLVNEILSLRLKEKYQKGKLKETGNKYHFYVDGKFKTCPVYECDDLRFITVIKDNELFFIKEEPLEFMTIPGEYDKVTTVKGLLINIPFLINDNYDESLLKEFLNNILLKDITNNKIKEKQKNIKFNIFLHRK